MHFFWWCPNWIWDSWLFPKTLVKHFCTAARSCSSAVSMGQSSSIVSCHWDTEIIRRATAATKSWEPYWNAVEQINWTHSIIVTIEPRRQILKKKQPNEEEKRIMSLKVTTFWSDFLHQQNRNLLFKRFWNPINGSFWASLFCPLLPWKRIFDDFRRENSKSKMCKIWAHTF